MRRRTVWVAALRGDKMHRFAKRTEAIGVTSVSTGPVVQTSLPQAFKPNVFLKVSQLPFVHLLYQPLARSYRRKVRSRVSTAGGKTSSKITRRSCSVWLFRTA